MIEFHSNIRKYLDAGIQEGKIPHAQLFIGDEGTGVLPVAIDYAAKIISGGEFNQPYQMAIQCQHPDLHFFFPNTTTPKVSSAPVSSMFMQEWRQFVTEQPFGGLSQWYQTLGVEKKQGQIGVNDARELTQKMMMRSYSGGYKVVIIWMPELMNSDCSNKLLKILEEPPLKTVFLLVSENKDKILPTISSRCQVIDFPKIGDAQITQALVSMGVEQSLATATALRSNGNFRKALMFLQENSEDLVFEKWFVAWVRTAYRAKANKAAILPLIDWSNDISSYGRETQKKFLEYCLEVFRQALLLNYGAPSLAYMKFKDPSFKLEKFAPFIHNGNIFEIQTEIEKAIFHVERNGNGKVIFTDLSIKLTRFIHRKPIQA